MARIRKEGKYGFIDDRGRIMIPCEFEYVSHFHEGRALYKDNGLSGYINKQGDIVIPAKYDKAGHIFEDGIVLVELDGMEFYVDRNGREYRQ
jgi:hypothetical protein